MTLRITGPISWTDINQELGRPPVTKFRLPDSSATTLFSTPSGQAGILPSSRLSTGRGRTNFSLNIDASNSASYPGTGSVWTDLSGNGNNVTLFGPPTYSSSNGGVINLNGTSQYARGNVNFLGSNQFTISMWLMNTERGLGDQNGQIFSLGNEKLLFYTEATAGGIPYVFSVYSPTIFNNIPRYSTTYVQLNTWYNLVGVYTGTSFEMFVNGQSVLVTTSNISLVSLTTETFEIGRRINNGFTFFPGRVANLQLYNRALPATEVIQNYNATRQKFGVSAAAPVVDSSLKLWLDTGSFPYSYTPLIPNTWRDLMATGRNGTLINSPVYNSSSGILNGAYLDFNGTSTLVQVSGSAVSLNTGTFVAWIRRNGDQSAYTGLVFSRGAVVTGLGFSLANQISYTWNDAANTYQWFSGLVPPDSTWCMVAVSVGSTAATAYLCQPSGITSATNTVSHASVTLDDIKIACDDLGGRFFKGQLSVAMIYDRVLSAAEIEQNYNAMRARYPVPVIGSGLRLWLDAGDTVSYPGAGTTWTDLSGNSNNGTFQGSLNFRTDRDGGSIGFTPNANDYVNLASSALLPLGTTDRTIIAFVRTPTAFPYNIHHVIHWGTANTDQAFGLGVFANGLVTSHTWGAGPNQGTVLTGTNYCLAVTYTHASTLHRFWVNGVSQGAGFARTINTVASAARVGLRLGAPLEEQWGPDGRIYNIVVYNRALTDREIQQHYNALCGRYILPQVPPTGPARVTFVATTAVSNAALSNTFTAANIGTASVNRIVYVCAACVLASGTQAQTITSVTLDGIAMTKIVGADAAANSCGIWALAVAAGATANIVVTANRSQSAWSISVYNATNVENLIAGATGTYVASKTAPAGNLSLSPPAGSKQGFVLGIMADDNSTGGSFTGLETVNTASAMGLASSWRIVGFTNITTSAATYTYSADFTGGAGAVAAFCTAYIS
jgi:hypothetical protein